MALRVTFLVLDVLLVVATSLCRISNSPCSRQHQCEDNGTFGNLPDSSNAILAAGQDCGYWSANKG